MNRWTANDWILLVFVSALPLMIAGMFAAMIVDLVTSCP